VRILFVQLANAVMNPEHQVHRTFAAAAADRGVRATFLVPTELEDGRDPSGGPTEVTLDEQSIATWPRDLGPDGPLDRIVRRADQARLFAPVLARAIDVHRRVRPDVVYTSQQQLDILVGQALSARFGTPHIIHLHYHVGPWLGRIVQRLVITSERVIAVSEFVRASAMLRGAAPGHVTTVHNPIAGAVTADRDHARAMTRAALGLDEETPVVIAAGRLDPGKGHEELLEAIALVRDEVSDVVLLVCGKSSWGVDREPLLAARAAELGIRDSVRFLGHRTDLPALLASADVFCLPSQLEPFGLVYLEAMRSQLPVAASWSGGVPEIVVHGQTGLLSSPSSPGDLASDLVTLLKDRSLRAQMGEAGARRASEAFSPDRLSRKWCDVVEKLAEGTASRWGLSR
jgi:glycosyltransferase involved in cell wall biosynthesis